MLNLLIKLSIKNNLTKNYILKQLYNFWLNSFTYILVHETNVARFTHVNKYDI